MNYRNRETARVTSLVSRRDALKKTAALGTGLVIGASLITSRSARAAELPRLEEGNPQARALGYRHDAAAVDTAKFPTADPAAKNCANCQLFQPHEDSSWGGCPLFAGKGVNAQGWCTAWANRIG